MSEIHAATSNPKAREIVQVVLDEFDRWAKHAPTQAAGLYPKDSEAAAKHALYDVRSDLMDHLVVGVGITLASWGVSS